MSNAGAHRFDLPAPVVKSWGMDAAEAFEHWLDNKLLAVRLKSQVEIPASIARQKVNVLMLEHVGGLLAAEPTLIQLETGHWVWRVPVDLAFPRYGRVGQVADLDVDARFGMIDYDDNRLEQIRQKAHQMAEAVLKSEAATRS